ncbi:MAG: hypothetical protein WBH47_13295, partial [Streptosporangiaceae bacterium]
MAQQGSPPGRMSRRAEDDQHGRGGAVRARRAASQRPGWQGDAFGPADTDPDLPPWAGPSGYLGRPGGARRRSDPYAADNVGEARSAEDGHAGAE